MFIYLDTHFISQFAKLEMGNTKIHNSSKLESLLNKLRQGAKKNVINCPPSHFLLQEIKDIESPKLENKCLEIINSLNNGYYLKYWWDILVHQAANQLLISMGRAYDINLGWNAFTRVVPETTSTNFTKEMKKSFEIGASILRTEKAPKRTLCEQYQAEVKAFIQESFLQPLRRTLNLETWSDPHVITLLAMLVKEINVSRDEYQKLLDFFDSYSVYRIELLHIFCLINASLRVNEKSRRDRGSDLSDVATLASAIRYCDIVTTDNNMKKNVVDRLRLDSTYNTCVLSRSSADLDILLERISTCVD